MPFRSIHRRFRSKGSRLVLGLALAACLLSANAAEIDIEKGRDFWSFQPPRSRPAPAVENSAWPRSDLDRFILARLEQEKIRPAPDASPRTLLRRVYYDLIGLPPSPDEMNAFLEDSSTDPLETVVDDLLARPEFGERWGRHWLDVARFAESSGGGRSLMFPHAWRFRDYVIDSFNNDKPFDQFVKEQIAGDLLEAADAKHRNELLVACGYLVLGAINYELQDKELLRMEVIDEQVDAVGRSFLAMTLGCARCHDHKFDPIPTTDYYALAGIFGSTQSLTPGNVSNYVMQKLDAPVPAEVLAHRKKVEAAEVALKKARAELKKLGGKVKPESPRVASLAAESLPGIVIDNSKAKVTGHWTSSRSVGGWIGSDYIHDEGQPKGQRKVEYEARLPLNGLYEVRVSYTAGTNRSKNTPVTIHFARGNKTVRIDQTVLPAVDGHFVSVGKFQFKSDTPARVVISNEGTSAVVIADAVQILGPPDKKEADSVAGKGRAEDDVAVLAKREIEARQEAARVVAKLEKELNALKKQGPKHQDPVAMSVKESANPEDGHVHIRGGVRNKGARVPRGFISVAMPPGASSSAHIEKGQSGRLQLAEWIASPENPLTARVMVNRIWKHLMGEGIVRTPDNFGDTGERPSHPDLLDYLALRFIEKKWSTKSMIREIVLSRTYGLSSALRPEDDSADPENRLFGRANRKRLDAECIRDTTLLVSGQLDTRRGGLTIRKLSQYDLSYQFDTVRRSVYVPWFRNSMLDIFEVFDVANPNLVVGRRTVTNLPTQALYLMNSPFIRKQAEFTAGRLLKEKATIEEAYQWILCRLPTLEEKESTASFLARFEEGQEQEAWTQVCHTLFACVDFRYLE